MTDQDARFVGDPAAACVGEVRREDPRNEDLIDTDPSENRAGEGAGQAASLHASGEADHSHRTAWGAPGERPSCTREGRDGFGRSDCRDERGGGRSEKGAVQVFLLRQLSAPSRRDSCAVDTAWTARGAGGDSKDSHQRSLAIHLVRPVLALAERSRLG